MEAAPREQSVAVGPPRNVLDPGPSRESIESLLHENALDQIDSWAWQCVDQPCRKDPGAATYLDGYNGYFDLDELESLN
jgi:hypothetical protein